VANNGKYLALTAGVITEETAINTSAGAGDASKVIRTDSAGLLPVSMLPSGVGAEVVVATASEALAAGDFVNLWNSTGLKVRKADATVAGKEAVGFVLAAVLNAASATVFLSSQQNSSVSGKTVGARQWLSTTPGLSTETAPSASGNIVQQLGFATAAANVLFNPQQPITVA
jgi:hypothetical protein